MYENILVPEYPKNKSNSFELNYSIVVMASPKDVLIIFSADLGY